MAVKYLLECSCGEKVPVSASQAGQNVCCSCGLEQEVPTLLKLRKLETVEEAPPKRSLMDVGGSDGSSNWSPVQGVITAGVLLSVFALVWLIYVIATKPAAPKELISDELIERKIDEMTLLQTVQMWHFLQQDIRVRIRSEHQYLIAMKAYKVRYWIVDILLAVSICFTVLTIIFSKRAAAKRAEALEKENSADATTNPTEN